MQRDDEAVSPVIATVLLLAITVLLSSMVFVMMASKLLVNGLPIKFADYFTHDFWAVFYL